MSQEFHNIINSNSVMFFSKDGCKFCDLLENDLVSLGIPCKNVKLTNHLRDTLIEHTKCSTVPQLFIGGVFCGGYKEFSTLCGTGILATLLEPFGIAPVLDF